MQSTQEYKNLSRRCLAIIASLAVTGRTFSMQAPDVDGLLLTRRLDIPSFYNVKAIQEPNR